MKKFFKKTIRFLTSQNLFLLVSILLQIAIIIGMFSIASSYATKILGSAVTIFAFILAIYINDSSLHYDIKLSYIILLVLFPVYGTLTYLLGMIGMGNRKFNKHMTRLANQTKKLKQNDDAIRALDSDADRGLGNYLYTSGAFPTYQNTRAEFYSSGQALFNAMLNAIKQAQKFVFLEYFIIEEGEMLTALEKLLVEKVKEGVEVRFMYDGTSSISKIPHSHLRKLKKMGIKAKMFLPVRAILSTEQNNRDHRKLLIIDNKIGFTGGINIADEYINAVQKFGYWKDVGLKIEGQAVTSLTQMFLKMWNFKEKIIEDFAPYLSEEHIVDSDGFVIPFSDHPHRAEYIYKTVLLQLLAKAKKSVHITTPYLILDDELRQAFITTARRGVDVSIVTPNCPDKKIVYAVTQSNYRKLIENNIKIYQYQPGFIHAKMLLCDDESAIVGTVNLDYRSLYLNFENSIYLYKSSCIKHMKADFEDILSQSRRITRLEYKKINIFKRFLGRILKILAPLL